MPASKYWSYKMQNLDEQTTQMSSNLNSHGHGCLLWEAAWLQTKEKLKLTQGGDDGIGLGSSSGRRGMYMAFVSSKDNHTEC